MYLTLTTKNTFSDTHQLYPWQHAETNNGYNDNGDTVSKEAVFDNR